MGNLVPLSRIENTLESQAQWLTPIILVTHEVEIGSIKD
jgi:hypothetical protein